MNTLNITQAQTMEQNGELIIYHTGTVKSILNELSNYSIWKSNFQELKTQYKKIPRGKLLDFLSFDYIIECEEQSNCEEEKIIWTYMYGKKTESASRFYHSHNKGQYVYILTNEAYPEICKIGKAVMPISRIKQINGAGTVSEWKLRWALPVSDGYVVESVVHKSLENLRRDSIQGSSREFFEISLEEAIVEVEKLGEYFKTSEGIWYE
jgi:hypothetical protein